jgi:hypothetical protein
MAFTLGSTLRKLGADRRWNSTPTLTIKCQRFTGAAPLSRAANR